MILNIGEISKSLTCLNAESFLPHFSPFTCILLSMNYKRNTASRSLNCFCKSFLKARLSKQPGDQHILISMKWTATIPNFHGILWKPCQKNKTASVRRHKRFFLVHFSDPLQRYNEFPSRADSSADHYHMEKQKLSQLLFAVRDQARHEGGNK